MLTVLFWIYYLFYAAATSLRLRKRALQPNPPFVSGVCESHNMVGNVSAFI